MSKMLQLYFYFYISLQVLWSFLFCFFFFFPLLFPFLVKSLEAAGGGGLFGFS